MKLVAWNASSLKVRLRRGLERCGIERACATRSKSSGDAPLVAVPDAP